MGLSLSSKGLVNFIVVMGSEQYLRELRVIMMSRFSICVNHKFCERQFPPFFMILSEKHANFYAILSDIADITITVRERDFTI